MITHDFKLFFIHIPKCAGRSVSEIFNQRFEHFTSRYYEKEYSRFWNDSHYEVFTIVRNPYDRLVSIYHYIQQHRRHKFEPIACNCAPFNVWARTNLTAHTRYFDRESPQGERGTDWMVGSPYWFSPQICFLDTDKVRERLIFSFESGMGPINAYLKKKGVNKPILHINKSEHRPYQTYYDEELLQFVNTTSFIKDDCEKFNYRYV